MENPLLKGYISNDVEKTITQRGAKFRRKINPFFVKILSAINPYKLKVERKSNVPKEKAVIYAANHSFRDDVLNSLLTINGLAYIFTGIIDQFLQTFDGVKMFFAGIIMVDRKDEVSKKVSKQKMLKTLEMGVDILIFPEATWCLSPNKLVENFHIGSYDVIKDADSVYVPIITHTEGKNCYAIREEPFDITKLSDNQIFEMLKIIKSNAYKVIDLNLVDSNTKEARISNQPLSIMLVHKMNKILELMSRHPMNEELVELAILEANNCVNVFKELYHADSIDEIGRSTLERSLFLVKQINYIKKYVVINGTLRDKIASAKYELIEKYSYYGKNKEGIAKLEKLLSLLDNDQENEELKLEIEELKSKIWLNIDPLSEEGPILGKFINRGKKFLNNLYFGQGSKETLDFNGNENAKYLLKEYCLHARREEWENYVAMLVDQVKKYDLFQEQSYVYFDPYVSEVDETFIHLNGDLRAEYLNTVHRKTKKHKRS